MSAFVSIRTHFQPKFRPSLRRHGQKADTSRHNTRTPWARLSASQSILFNGPGKTYLDPFPSPLPRRQILDRSTRLVCRSHPRGSVWSPRDASPWRGGLRISGPGPSSSPSCHEGAHPGPFANRRRTAAAARRGHPAHPCRSRLSTHAIN